MLHLGIKIRQMITEDQRNFLAASVCQVSGFKYLPVESRQTNIGTLVFPKLKQAHWAGRLTSSGATCYTAWMESPCLTLELHRSRTATDPSPARIWWTRFRCAPSCWCHFLFRWHAPSCNDRYHNMNTGSGRLRLWTPLFLEPETSSNRAALSPVPNSLICGIRKLFFCGLGKEEDQSSTQDRKTAEDYDGDGPVVHGQHVTRRRQQAGCSEDYGAQTDGRLPVSNVHSPNKRVHAQKVWNTLHLYLIEVGNISCM